MTSPIDYDDMPEPEIDREQDPDTNGPTYPEPEPIDYEPVGRTVYDEYH